MKRPLDRGALAALSAVLLAACKENLSPATPSGPGPDLAGPTVQLSPGRDTSVTGTTLNIGVTARDPSGIKFLNLYLVGGTFGFAPLAPNDTAVSVIYPVPLADYRGSSFGFFVRALDVLDRETVTATVTVTVR